MGAPRARVQLVADRLHLEWPGVAACMQLTAGCRLTDGREHSCAAWTEAREVPGRYVTSCGPLRIELHLQPTDGCVRMRLEATVQEPADVTQVTVSARVELPGEELAWVLYNGYHSWDQSGYARAGAMARESWWTVGLAAADGRGIAAAATAARDSCTRYTLADGVLTTAWREAETLIQWPTLFVGEEGTRWRSAEVLLSAGADVRERLAALAQPGGRSAPVQVGWLSWYHHGPWVTREDLLAHADILAGDEYRRLGYRLIQLDDGWQEAYGDWKPNTKFAAGIRTLCDELRARGLVAGIWTAPFLVSASADLATQAPDDWLLVDPTTGEPAVDQRHRAFGPMYALDPSRPDVLAHLHDVFAGLYAAGIRYFKIDFLYAGGFAGARALRAGLQAIRDAA